MHLHASCFAAMWLASSISLVFWESTCADHSHPTKPVPLHLCSALRSQTKAYHFTETSILTVTIGRFTWAIWSTIGHLSECFDFARTMQTAVSCYKHITSHSSSFPTPQHAQPELDLGLPSDMCTFSLKEPYAYGRSILLSTAVSGRFSITFPNCNNCATSEPTSSSARACSPQLVTHSIVIWLTR